MTIKYTSEFLSLLKKQNVRVRKSFKKAVDLFSQNPNDPVLKNHNLAREWKGYKSINVTSDYRAIFREVTLNDETIVYFTTIGTHEKLYSPQ